MGEEAAAGLIEAGKKFGYGSAAQLEEFGPAASTFEAAPVPEGLFGYWLQESVWARAVSQNIRLVDPSEFLLRHLEFVLSLRIDKVCGHQETADLLAHDGAQICGEIRRDPHKLHALNRVLKECLKRREPITGLARLCEPLKESSPETPPRHESSAARIDSAVTSMTVYVSPQSPLDRAQLAQDLSALQATMFQELGIILPRIGLVESNGIERNDFQIEINGEKLSPTQGLVPGEFWVFVPFEIIHDRFPLGRAAVEPNSGMPAAIVKGSDQDRQEFEKTGVTTRDPVGYVLFNIGAETRRRADVFLTHEMVERYLALLETRMPALVGVTRHYFSIDDLIQRLREQLRKRVSIRNLPQALEMFLEQIG